MKYILLSAFFIILFLNTSLAQKLSVPTEYQYTNSQIDSLNQKLKTTSDQSKHFSKLHFYLGMAYAHNDNISKSTEHFLKAIQYSKIKNYDIKAQSYIMLTHIYILTGKKEESNYYLKKIVDIQNKIESDSIYFSALSYVAGYHSSITHETDSAIYIEHKIIRDGSKFIDTTLLQSAYFNLSANYIRVQKLDSAYKYIQKGFSIKKQNKDEASEINEANRQLMFGYHILTKIDLGRSKYEKALVPAKLFSSMAIMQKDTFYIYHAYKQLSNVYFKLKQMDSAYYYQKSTLEMYKSVVNSDMQNELNEVKLQTEFEYNRKLDSLKNNKVIQEKNTIIKLGKEKKETLNKILFVALLFLLILIILILKILNSKKLITSQKNQLERSLKHNESLLNEAHHRVKNNLQIVSSLLDNQSISSSDKKVKAIIKVAQNRIQSMALLHQLLNQDRTFYKVNLEQHVIKLVHLINESYFNSNTKVKLNIIIQEKQLRIDTVIPLGLIITELVSNSLIHAFTHQKEGEITVSIKKDKLNFYLLTVTDNGIGIDSTLDNTTSLGLELVHGLAWQLGGKVTMIENIHQGTSVNVTFIDNLKN